MRIAFSFYGYCIIWAIICLLSIQACPAPLKGQIIVDPDHPGRMVYHDTYVNGRLKPVFFAGPGDPEEMLYYHTDNTIDKLIQKGARCVYVVGYSTDDFNGNPGSGAALDATLNKWDSWITRLENAGIITFFIFFDDASTWWSDWQNYCDKTVQKLKHHKLLVWCIKEEYAEMASASSRVSSFASRLKAQDDHNHVVSVHQNIGTSFDFNSNSNLDMFAIQLDNSLGAYHSKLLSAWNNVGGNKILNMSEGFVGGVVTGKQSDSDMRYINWASAMGGASAVMHIGMGRFYAVSGYGNEMGINSTKSFQDCAIIMDFFESTDYNYMAPHDELAAGGTEWLLANPGKSYIAYAGNLSGGIGINNMTADTYSLIWLDIPSGAKKTETKTVSGGTNTFSRPSGIGTEVAVWIASTTITTPDNTPPAQPGNLNTAVLGEASIKLTWTAASDNESGIASYNIYRDNVLIGTSSSLEFTDNGLLESTTYSYQVSAVNGSGLESGKTSAVPATTLADTEAPTIIAVSISGEPTVVTVTFSEKIDKAEAENKANYSINNNIQVNSAALQTDGITVTLSTTSHQEKADYTLTVNNIKDVSKRENVIAPNSTAAYQYYSTVEITNLNPSSYRVEIRNPSDSIYVDRDYTFTSFWTGYDQDITPVIMTANSDKSSTGAGHLSFDVNIDAEVLIGVAGGSPLSWMDGWEKTGKTVTSSHGVTYTVFKKDFAKGTVTLGGNEGSGSNMYIVFVTRPSELPVIEEQKKEIINNDTGLMIYPNPFKLSTGIKFEIHNKQRLSLKIYDLRGKLIATLADGEMGRGTHLLEWQSKFTQTGLFIAKLKSGSRIMTGRLLSLK